MDIWKGKHVDKADQFKILFPRTSDKKTFRIFRLPATHSPVFCVSWHDVSSHIGHCGHGVVVVVTGSIVVVVVTASVVVVVVVATSGVDTFVVAEISGELEPS